MIDDMGIFYTTIEISSVHDHERRHELRDVMVDTGSEYSWVSRQVVEQLGITAARTERFEAADGRVLEREIGFAMVFAAGRATPTIVVLGEPGDMTLLGAITLEGLNMRVDLARRALVPAGPVPVAHARAIAERHDRYLAETMSS